MFKSILAVIILTISANSVASEVTCVNNETGFVSEYNQHVVTVHGDKAGVYYKTNIDAYDWAIKMAKADNGKMFTCAFK